MSWASKPHTDFVFMFTHELRKNPEVMGVVVLSEKLLEDDRNGRKASELNNLQKQSGGRELEYRPSLHQIEVHIFYVVFKILKA